MPLNTKVIYRVIYSPTAFDYAWADKEGDIVRFSSYKQANRWTGNTLVIPVSEDEFNTIAELDICEAFNTRRQGMCKRPLTPLGDCPEAHLHGDEFSSIVGPSEFDVR
jgi:hypothetical protein